MKSCPLLVALCVFISVSEVVASTLDNIRYVGCYDPGYSLKRKYHHHIVSINLTHCVQTCKILHTQYAAVEASDNYCYCGNDIGEESTQRNDTLCNYPCPDDADRTCGGDWLISLYSIGGADHVETGVDVDFLVGTSIGVRMYHSTDMNNFETLMTTVDWVDSLDYHLAKRSLFAVSKKKLYRTNMDHHPPLPPPLPSQMLRVIGSCDGIAVDWVHDLVYWANCDPLVGTSIMRFGLNGENEQTVMASEELAGKRLRRMVIDPYKGQLFWLADGSLQSVDTSGEDFHPNMTDAEVTVRVLTLDLRKRWVYYVAAANEEWTLYSMDYNGGEVVKYFSGPHIRSVYGLGVVGNKVFWVNYANVKDVLYEAPLNLTQGEDVKTLKTIDKAVWHMKVVHASLQRRPVIDPCLEKGCVHGCVLQGVASATCQCPSGHELNHDGVSCREVAEPGYHAGAAVIFLITLLLVAAVVVTSLVLVYLGNKYWSQLERKLFGVPYSRNRGGEGIEEAGVGVSEYHAGEDKVNLI